MLKYLALVACTCALAVTPFALAADESQPSSTPESTPPPCERPVALARQAYALGEWKGGPDHALLERVHAALACTDHPREARRAIAKHRERFGEYWLYRDTATYRGPGSGPRSPADGRWWSIPYWPIVCGESHGNFYVNDDGGYQIIPSTWRAHTPSRRKRRDLERRYHVHLAFASVAGESGELEQHIVAARAWAAGEPWYGRC